MWSYWIKAIKSDIGSAVRGSVDNDGIFTVETDASDKAIGAVLSQNGRPVAFFSRSLNAAERKHSSVEKEAAACVAAVKRWSHYLANRRFVLITDQRSVSFMLDSSGKGKTKNAKIARWRLELLGYDFDIRYRPGSENAAADPLSRDCVWSLCSNEIKRAKEAHDSLCHPGVEQMWDYVKARKWPITLEEVRQIVSDCPICLEVKPRFLKTECAKLIKSCRPWERVVMDFKGPVALSENGNKYLLVVVDEFSRFPFAVPCKDQTTDSVISALTQLFSLFGLPESVHSDHGPAFESKELKSFLLDKGINTSQSCPYHPKGNGQCERFVGTIWKALELGLRSRGLDWSEWERVLPGAPLHSIISLLNTVTRESPRQRFLGFERKRASGSAISKWLLELEGKEIWLRNFARKSKSEGH